jgi:hypothetical protein
MPTFFQFALGGVTINNFIKQQKNRDMGNNLMRWIGTNLGRPNIERIRE